MSGSDLACKGVIIPLVPIVEILSLSCIRSLILSLSSDGVEVMFVSPTMEMHSLDSVSGGV